MQHPVWKSAVNELKSITEVKFPHLVLNSLTNTIAMISKSFFLLSDETSEVTADDLLQLTTVVIRSSGLPDLQSYLNIVKTFCMIPNQDNGMKDYIITTFESSIQYLKSIKK